MYLQTQGQGGWGAHIIDLIFLVFLNCMTLRKTTSKAKASCGQRFLMFAISHIWHISALQYSKVGV